MRTWGVAHRLVSSDSTDDCEQRYHFNNSTYIWEMIYFFLYTCMIYKASCIQLLVNWRFLKVKGAYKYPNWMSHHVFLENFQTGVGLFSIPKIKLQFFIFLAKRLQYKTKFIFIADFFLTNCLRSVFLGMDLKGISYSYSPLPVSLTRSKKWRRQGCLLPALHQALVNHSEKLFAPSCQ